MNVLRRALQQTPALARARYTTAPPASLGGPRRRWLWWAAGAAGIAAPAAYGLWRARGQPGAARDPRHSHGAIVLESLKDTSVIREESRPTEDPLVKPSPPVYTAKYLLLGGGLASYAAMEAIRSLEKDADILMVTDESYPPYMRPPLSKEMWFNHEPHTGAFEFTDWHGFKKPIFFQDTPYYAQADEDQAHAAHRRPRLLTGKQAVRIEGNTAYLHDGTTIRFEKALLATGSRPRTFSYCLDPNVENITCVRKIDDVRRIKRAVDSAGHIAIIGGGFAGSELAASLASYAEIERPDRPLKITQIFPEEGNMGLVFPRYLSQWTMQQIRRLGVDVWPKCNITSISRTPEDQVRVTVDSGQSVVVDHVISSIGAVPNSAVAEASKMEIDQSPFAAGGVKVSKDLVIVPNTVFGAGDVISYWDSSLELWRRAEHYDHALMSGRVAGRNMTLQDPLQYQKYSIVSMFWSDLGPNIGYEAVGLCDSSLTTIGIWAKTNGAAGETPKSAHLHPTDLKASPVGQTAPIAPSPAPELQHDHTSGPVDDRKGLVLYVRDRRIVGLLMFNLFNRSSLAKKIIRQHLTVEDLQDIADLFEINGTGKPP